MAENISDAKRGGPEMLLNIFASRVADPMCSDYGFQPILTRNVTSRSAVLGARSENVVTASATTTAAPTRVGADGATHR